MKKNYAAITGDLVQSRSFTHRDKIQSKLVSVLEKVNKQFRDFVMVKFTIILGDEFQGLVSSIEKSYDIVKMIQKELYPVKVLFGIGVGSFSTRIMKTTAQMDGECFCNSRDALQKAKYDDISIIYKSGDDKKDIAINTISYVNRCNKKRLERYSLS